VTLWCDSRINSGDRAKVGSRWRGQPLMARTETGERWGIFHRFPPSRSHVPGDAIGEQWRRGAMRNRDRAESRRPGRFDPGAWCSYPEGSGCYCMPAAVRTVGGRHPARRRRRTRGANARKDDPAAWGSRGVAKPEGPMIGRRDSVARPAMRRQPER